MCAITAYLRIEINNSSSLAIFAYGLTVMLAFPKFGLILGTLLAYVISLIVAVLLMNVQPKTKEILNITTNR
ncbi:hypothetical protein HY933_03235 [Candidatus Falkowbacteria bacterium]|nr:hypothetical protein [Candidatus Falkowbacteria bacterium]